MYIHTELAMSERPACILVNAADIAQFSFNYVKIKQIYWKF